MKPKKSISKPTKTTPVHEVPAAVPTPVNILTVSTGLADLIRAGVFTPRQIFYWIIKGIVPSEFTDAFSTLGDLCENGEHVLKSPVS